MIFDVGSVGTRRFRKFSLSPQFLSDYEGKQPKWGYGGLSYFTYKRTYSRPLEDGATEEFWQTCQRVVEGVYNTQKIHCRRLNLPWNEAKAQKSAQEMFERIWAFKWTPPGRGLWMMGTDTVLDKGSASLNNCSFVSSGNLAEDFAGPFCFLMDNSMLGVGVGGDTRGAGKVKLSTPKSFEDVYVVDDSREGWVAVTRQVLDSFVGKSNYPSVIDFSKVRRRGSPIRGFGGVASGPTPLSNMLKGLTKLLAPEGVEVQFEEQLDSNGEPQKLAVWFEGEGPSYRITSTHIVDVFNMIGACVVAGGLRRSAEIMLGDPEDLRFLDLKNPASLNALSAERAQVASLVEGGDTKASLRLEELDAAIENHPLRTHRWCSNNSVIAKVGMDYSDVAERLATNGEPGLFWIENAQAYGRMNGHPDNKDYRVQGTNPCAEISLESAELCNLAEVYPANHDSYEDLERTLKYAYLYAKSVSLIPSHDPRTNAVMMRNRRVGVSMSGIRQATSKHGFRTYMGWCDQGYQYLKGLDRIYSGWLCVPRSIRLTTVKPSGTVSILSGSTPGIHAAHSEFYIRNVRVAGTSPLVEAARKAGYIVEKDVYADDTFVVSFPVKSENFDKGKKDCSIWEQTALSAAMQRYWSDNSVSITVTFKKGEADQIKDVLNHFEDKLKTISFLPLSEHGYEQAPYIEIDEATYKAMTAKIQPLDFGTTATHDIGAEDKFCDGDKCELPPV